MRGYTLVIPEFRRKRQEYQEFQVICGYTVNRGLSGKTNAPSSVMGTHTLKERIPNLHVVL